eukprot:ANDGO_06337.mRNA.1 hypothetical protein
MLINSRSVLRSLFPTNNGQQQQQALQQDQPVQQTGASSAAVTGIAGHADAQQEQRGVFQQVRQRFNRNPVAAIRRVWTSPWGFPRIPHFLSFPTPSAASLALASASNASAGEGHCADVDEDGGDSSCGAHLPGATCRICFEPLSGISISSSEALDSLASGVSSSSSSAPNSSAPFGEDDDGLCYSCSSAFAPKIHNDTTTICTTAAISTDGSGSGGYSRNNKSSSNITTSEVVCAGAAGAGQSVFAVKEWVVPCACTGTQQYVHVSCLDLWRKRSSRTDAYVRCDVCRTPYAISISHVPSFREFWTGTPFFHTIFPLFCQCISVASFASLLMFSSMYVVLKGVVVFLNASCDPESLLFQIMLLELVNRIGAKALCTRLIFALMLIVASLHLLFNVPLSEAIHTVSVLLPTLRGFWRNAEVGLAFGSSFLRHCSSSLAVGIMAGLGAFGIELLRQFRTYQKSHTRDRVLNYVPPDKKGLLKKRSISVLPPPSSPSHSSPSSPTSASASASSSTSYLSVNSVQS